jgi:hypothetical protein
MHRSDPAGEEAITGSDVEETSRMDVEAGERLKVRAMLPSPPPPVDVEEAGPGSITGDSSGKLTEVAIEPIKER